MRVHVVDPSAYTPPYDHALCGALAALDTQVDLFTSRFAYGPVARPNGYARHEFFYRAAFGAPAGRVRMASKLVQHVPDMLRYRSAARRADVVHFQWLAVQHLDRYLLPAGRTTGGRRRPLVITAHDVLPREPRPGQLTAQRRLYDRFDAIVVHSEHGRLRLVDELGMDGGRVHVIPHGVFAHLAAGGDALSLGGHESPLPGGRYASASSGRPAGAPPSPEAFPVGDVLAPEGALRPRTRARAEHPSPENNNPVVLMFGLMRPYKGIDVLLEAWRGVDGQAPIEDAQLCLAGMPKMDISALQAAAPANVRFEPRFITDSELPAYFERASLVVLPYLHADQSGVLFTALAFGKPLLLSDVGGFPEIEATGAARIVPAGNATVLGQALRELLADRATLTKMCVKARAAATGRYSWPAIAAAHLELYRSI
ncbi:MAG: glycosyltransferase family 4 protein [Solirubrobacteraceae bacterium]